MKRKQVSPNTVKSCLASLRLYFSLYQDISVENLTAYKEYLLCHYKPATVNNRIYGLNRNLDSLEGTPEQLEGGFRLSVIRTQTAPFADNIISESDYEHLKNSLKDSENQFWYFVVRFLACTGARISELLQIKAEHLNLGYMNLCSKGETVRRIYFPDSLCDEAKEWIKSRFIFVKCDGKPITSRGIGCQLKVLARFNDISLLAGLMGHESIETTRIYLLPSSKEQRETIDRIVTW